MTEWLRRRARRAGRREQRWPMTPTHLLPRERWLWWQQLWADVIMLAERYRISPSQGLVGERIAGRGARRVGRLGRALRLRRMG